MHPKRAARLLVMWSFVTTYVPDNDFPAPALQIIDHAVYYSSAWIG